MGRLWVTPTIGAYVTPALGTLSLSVSAFTKGTTATVNILGTTAGSTIAGSSLPTGFTVNSSARTLAYDGTGSVGAGTLSLVETPSGGGASNTSVISYSLAAAAAYVNPTITIDTPVTNPPTFTANTGDARVGTDWLRLVQSRDNFATTSATETVLFTSDVALDMANGDYAWSSIGPAPFSAGAWYVRLDVLAPDGAAGAAGTVLGSSNVANATLVAATGFFATSTQPAYQNSDTYSGTHTFLSGTAVLTLELSGNAAAGSPTVTLGGVAMVKQTAANSDNVAIFTLTVTSGAKALAITFNQYQGGMIAITGTLVGYGPTKVAGSEIYRPGIAFTSSPFVASTAFSGLPSAGIGFVLYQDTGGTFVPNYGTTVYSDPARQRKIGFMNTNNIPGFSSANGYGGLVGMIFPGA